MLSPPIFLTNSFIGKKDDTTFNLSELATDCKALVVFLDVAFVVSKSISKVVFDFWFCAYKFWQYEENRMDKNRWEKSIIFLFTLR